VAVLAACADGTLFPNPRHLAANTQRLAAAQQVLAKTRRRPSSSHRREKARVEVARLHRRVANQRKDTLHKLSRLLIDRYDTIALEDLRVTNMVRSAAGTLDAPGVNVAAKAGLNRSIHDAGWAQLANMIVYKAENAGRQVIFVNAANTSRTCSTCGHRHAKDRTSQARWQCCNCGLDTNADVNAAINIATRAGLARHDTTTPMAAVT
jgi:putative transposase